MPMRKKFRNSNPQERHSSLLFKKMHYTFPSSSEESGIQRLFLSLRYSSEFSAKSSSSKVLLRFMQGKIQTETEVEGRSNYQDMPMWEYLLSVPISGCRDKVLFENLHGKIHRKAKGIQESCGVTCEDWKKEPNVREEVIRTPERKTNGRHEAVSGCAQSDEGTQTDGQKDTRLQKEGENKREVSTQRVGATENRVSTYLSSMSSVGTRNTTNGRPHSSSFERWGKYNRQYSAALFVLQLQKEQQALNEI